MLESVQIPDTWTPKSYNNKTHYLVEISYCSPTTNDEYTEVVNYFDNYHVLKIERVQNPYQYGRYQAYKLQKNSSYESIAFMPIRSITELDSALRYNCDYRRLSYSIDIFFSLVSEAINFSSSCNKLIVLQVLENYKDHDSGRYAKYVVTYEKDD